MNYANQMSVKWRQPRYSRTGVHGILLVLAMLGIAGCSSLPTNLAADGSVRVERHDSHYVHLGPIHVGATAEGLRVSGELRKTFVRHGRISGHLHIELRAADGTILGVSVVRHRKPFAKSNRARFAHTFAVQPDDVRTVTVVHHGQGERHG